MTAERVESALGNDEPLAFELVRGRDSCPFFLACDHASARVPRQLGNLGLSQVELASHIAWDIGIAATARRLAALLGADLVLQNYSRLVIDCNRPLDADDSIACNSGGIRIPGNSGLTELQRTQRVAGVFRPYHHCIETELERRRAARHETIYVAMHSFTPVLAGVNRRWHVGVLYQRDARIANAMLESLRQEAGLVVGDNEPYRVTDQSDYSIVNHGERRGLLHVELELRQDLISAPPTQAVWAERLLEHLTRAAHSVRTRIAVG